MAAITSPLWLVKAAALLYEWERTMAIGAAERRVRVGEIGIRTPRWLHGAAADLFVGCYRRYLDLTADTAISPKLRAAVAYKLAEAYSSLGQADAARAVSAQARAIETQGTRLMPPDRSADSLHAADAPARR